MGDNICQRFCKTVEQRQGDLAVLQPANKYWQRVSWNQYGEHVRKTSQVLRSLGVRPGVRVALWAPTSYAWAVHDMAALSLGAITVPIYSNISQSDLIFQLNHSEAQLLICADETACQRLLAVKSQLSFLTSLVTLEKVTGQLDPLFKGDWISLMDQAEDIPVETFRRSCSSLNEDDLATLIYTSGTTGVPKGVLLAHGQIMSEVSEVYPLLGVTAQDRTLGLLPYAHILGRIELWGQALIGYTIGYATGADHLASDLKQIEPTIMVGVPRVFEKIQEAICEAAQESLIRKVAFNWALKSGTRLLQAKQERRSLSLGDAIQVAAVRRLAFRRVREGLGGKLRFAISGGAPLSRQTAEFFGALGVRLLEGYGLTETTAAVCVNTLFHHQIGTVGKPIGDVEIREADDGEILIRSKKVMKGYYLDPEETAKAFTEDGFLKTGDIGHLNEEGFLILTDRKKDLIKTSSGKFIAPQKLTSLFAKHPLIEHIHLHGDRRHYMVALITVSPRAARKFFSQDE